MVELQASQTQTGSAETKIVQPTSWLQLLFVAFLGAVFASMIGSGRHLNLLVAVARIMNAIFDGVRKAM